MPIDQYSLLGWGDLCFMTEHVPLVSLGYAVVDREIVKVSSSSEENLSSKTSLY